MRTGWRSESEAAQIPLAAQTDQIKSLFLMQYEDSNSVVHSHLPETASRTLKGRTDPTQLRFGWMSFSPAQGQRRRAAAGRARAQPRQRRSLLQNKLRNRAE